MAVTRVEFELTERMLIEGMSRFVARDPNTRRVVRQTWNRSMLFNGLMLAGLVWLQSEGFVDWVWVGCMAAAFVVVGIIFYPTGRMIARHARRHVTTGLRSGPGYRLVLGRRAVELHPDRVVSESPLGGSWFRWAVVLRVQNDDEYLILALPGDQTVFVPRLALDSDDEFDAFADEVRQRVRTADAPAAASL